jgi:hypothetical protein
MGVEVEEMRLHWEVQTASGGRDPCGEGRGEGGAAT